MVFTPDPFDLRFPLRELNSLLPPDSGWDLTAAYSLNDLGQIVGAGTFNGRPAAFLLIPNGMTPTSVPEPVLPALATLVGAASAPSPPRSAINFIGDWIGNQVRADQVEFSQPDFVHSGGGGGGPGGEVGGDRGGLQGGGDPGGSRGQGGESQERNARNVAQIRHQILAWLCRRPIPTGPVADGDFGTTHNLPRVP